ncbi:alpha/beta-hydrolase [Dentipellis sp. KUC8613]|nr:alpha/beta-hydrolase [Dentipellis sp. KUC8613]
MSRSNENPFTISIPDDALALLHQKLALTRFPDELDDADWEYGAPLADVKRLDGYDWRKAEAQLNTLPMFTRGIPVDGFGELNMHYVHQKSAVERAIPLLFVHGWPGSFIEVRKILPLLTAEEEGKPSFHVVALSLPGFGFSEAPKKRGFGLVQYAEVAHKLMLALGYEEYVTQGGDWGNHITGYIAHLYGPQHVKACHSNFPRPPDPSWTSSPLIKLKDVLSWYTPEEKAGLSHSDAFIKTGRGYNEQQSTRPQTLGYALADSPVGLLAWIYEKLVTWTDAYPWEDDEVLTWVSIYWFSRAGPAASARIYFEHAQCGKDLKRFTVPLGVSRFPKELNAPPKSWLSLAGNIVFDSWHPSGGHFAAHEKPEELVGDLKKMFGKGGPVYGIVPARSGYAA